MGYRIWVQAAVAWWRNALWLLWWKLLWNSCTSKQS